MSRFILTILLGALVALGPACSKDSGGGGGGAPPIASKDGAEGLKAMFEAMATACNGQDFAKGKALMMSLIAGKAQLKQIFRDDTPADLLDKVAESFKKIPPSDEKVACALVPGKGRTEITVHGSSVEDVLKNAPGTPAFLEFPGGARTVAKMLRPGSMIYEVEVTEPGEDMGTKYHLFFWDGGQWRMLGPVWRLLRGTGDADKPLRQ